MLRGVSNTLSDNEVRSYISEVAKHVVDVRLIRDKKSGMSRGFGFVEFDSVTEAQRWMEYQQGYFVIEGVEMKLNYTSTRQATSQLTECFITDSGDWSCARCGGHNFKRRDFCYKCHLSKSQSKSVMETIDGKDQIGTTPCNTLILRDLDALTLEDAIIKSLKSQFNCTVTQCEIMRDEATKVSRCFAFVELSSLSESRRIVEYYEDHPDKVFELSGKAISIDYAKNNFTTLMTTYKEALAKRFEETYEPPVHETSNHDANAAAAVAQAALNQKKMHKKSGGSTSVLPSNVTVEARAPESTGIGFELIVNGQRCTSVPTNPFNIADLGTAQFTTPDTNKFLFDQSTQYYFDPVTGLYYDHNSQYFFDRVSQQYLYWERSKKTFVPIDIPIKTGNNNDDKSKVVHTEGKKSKVTVAKKIAKEMEKWEKMMNSKKNNTHNTSVKRDQASLQNMREGAANSGFAMFSDTRADYCAVPLEEHGASRAAADDLVAAYNSESDPDDVIITTTSGNAPILSDPLDVLWKAEENRRINWDKMACLLCNRGFKDKLTLEKHRFVSELHKKNLDQLKEKLGISGICQSTQKVPVKVRYRDRAKERREKFGVPSPPRRRRYDMMQEEEEYDGKDRAKEENEEEEVEVSSVQGTSHVIPMTNDEELNIGSRLMAKMGWQHGQGLGRSNQGRTEIVEAEFVARGSGIGAAPKMQGTPSDSYRENLKRAMYAKYHDG